MFGVWQENWSVLTLFLACETQWKRGWGGEYLGLDYTALEAAMRLMNINNKTEIFEDIRAMEWASLEELHRG